MLISAAHARRPIGPTGGIRFLFPPFPLHSLQLFSPIWRSLPQRSLSQRSLSPSLSDLAPPSAISPSPSLSDLALSLPLALSPSAISPSPSLSDLLPSLPSAISLSPSFSDLAITLSDLALSLSRSLSSSRPRLALSPSALPLSPSALPTAALSLSSRLVVFFLLILDFLLRSASAVHRGVRPQKLLQQIPKRNSRIRAATKLDSNTAQIAPFPDPQIRTHKVTVHDRQRGVVHNFLVPEDQYILHTAESQNISLPFACRHGCCTSCAVRVKSGQLRQPEALGISAELKSKGYALLCVGFPTSDLEVETQDEDEVYWLQFGRYFARGPIDRDDIALELAMGDE